MSSEIDQSQRQVKPLAPARSAFRSDLEGLRAVAVSLVLLDHIGGWTPGGFVGVDIFFVLSGFLITSLLLKEHEKTGTISLRAFYARRVRRIIPVSLLVIVVTTIAAHVVFIGARVSQITVDAWYSALFAANWRFILVGQDYFAADRAVSPFQHYWSLAVEEQFYMVWPILVLTVLGAAAGKSKEIRPRILLAVLSVVTIASFAWAMAETGLRPDVAYFSTLSRAWELGVGGILAVLALRLRVRSKYIAPVIGNVGLVVIVASAVIISPDWSFPAPWALLPVLGTMMVIVAGCASGGSGQIVALTNPMSRYVGRISFSLYLWHWPVVVFMQPFLPESDWMYILLVAGLSVVLSAASFHCVEDPIRRSSWLTGKRKSHGLGHRARISDGLDRVWKIFIVGALSVVTGILCYTATMHTRPADISNSAERSLLVTAGVNQAVANNSDASQLSDLDVAISEALTSQEWPEFSVPLDDLEDAKADEWAVDRCIDVTESDIERCTYGAPASKTAIVLGDSVAISWLPGVRLALEEDGYEIVSLTMGQCPGAHVQVTNLAGEADFGVRCQSFQEWAVGIVKDLDPEMVIISSAENSLERLESGAQGEASSKEWGDGVAKVVRAVSGVGRRVFVFAPPPAGANLQGCVTRFSGPSDCTSTVSNVWALQAEAEVSALADGIGGLYVDTSPWFCDSARRCPAVIGSTPVRADGNHLTSAYAMELAPEIQEVLLGDSAERTEAVSEGLDGPGEGSP